jgi:hypothetical protein
MANPQKRCPASVNELREREELVDSWGTPYAVTCPPLAIASAGTDGTRGTPDDIK